MLAWTLRSVLALVLLSVVAGCEGGDGAGGAGGDDGLNPRCAALCEIELPELEGAYDVCSEESAAACEDLCAVRIADTSGICASCLLEDAAFPEDQYGGGSGQGSLGESERTIEGPGGSCTYTVGDQEEEEACIRQVHPRRIVECEVEFRPVTECQDVCGE